MKKLVNLFQSRTHEHKLHPAFRALRDSDIHVDARSLMNALYARMGDPNGNFPGDFQTDGFQWYCDNCKHLLFEEYFKLTDIDKQLPSTFAKFNANTALHKCQSCGETLQIPQKK